MKRLDGRVAIITGGASGIGAASARMFVAEGARVLIADMRNEPGEHLAKELGDAATFCRVDVSCEADVENAVGAAVDRWGRLDCMFNNAGFGGALGPIESTSVEEFDITFDVLLKGVFLGIKHAAPVMRRQGGGAIINTASVNSQVTSPNTSGYTASKHAIMGLTRAVALETIMTGVTCNAICPGTVRTNLSEHRIETFAAERQKSTEDVIDEYLEQKMPYHQAMKRFITVEEIAAGAVYLCSDAGAAMRGAAFTIDGGWTIR